MALTGIIRTPGLRSHGISVVYSQQEYYLVPSCTRMLTPDKDTDVNLFLHNATQMVCHSHILWALLQISCHPRRISLGLQLCPECHCCCNWHLAACSSQEIYTMVKHLHTAHTRPLPMECLPTKQLCCCRSTVLQKRLRVSVLSDAGGRRLLLRQ